MGFDCRQKEAREKLKIVLVYEFIELTVSLRRNKIGDLTPRNVFYAKRTI